jgi:cellulose synthase/poly-beta-1,6-N-acetylglucosamine synthase-like glycosyltransferase
MRFFGVLLLALPLSMAWSGVPIDINQQDYEKFVAQIDKTLQESPHPWEDYKIVGKELILPSGAKFGIEDIKILSHMTYDELLNEFSKRGLAVKVYCDARKNFKKEITSTPCNKKEEFNSEFLKENINAQYVSQFSTLNKANKIINENLIENIRVVSFDTSPVNKPHALNVGLKNLKNEVVGIFDAEDEPHKNILNIINTIYQRGEADVVQSGVQLMNHKTRWYSFHSVLEYFFWFKSGLLFFSRIGKTTPLGGNTVFIKTPKLREVGGWDENILTEDADLGIRLSMVGAKTKVIYDELHVTREESPQKIPQMIKQRTRWNLGFLQVIMKGDWRKLPTLRQRIFAFYILVSPFPQSLFIILSPISIFIALSNKLPMLLTLFSLVPLYLFVLQIVIQIVATYEFSKIYRLKYSFFTPFKTFVTFFPYQIFLLISALRALFRLFTGQFGWEKTHHSNLHRKNLNFET